MTTASPLDYFRSAILSRCIGNFTVLMFTVVFYLSPTGRAVAEEVEQPEVIELQGSSEQKMNQALLKLQQVSAEKQLKISQRIEVENSLLEEVLDFFGVSQLSTEDISDLQILSTLLEEQHVQAMVNFAQIEAELTGKNLPEVILQKHQDTVSQYQTAYDDMQQKLQAVLNAQSLGDQEIATDALDELMKNQKLKKRHQKIDPNNLPWGTPDASKTRKPGETAAELSALTGIPPWPQGTYLAANVITPEMLGQPGGPIAEDLAETPDIKFTDAIKAKALELDEDPVKIYNWVRNTIEFIPSYGSIQGADYTLQHGKGNAFDTASLLIALLRVANIPARYAYGSVEMTAEDAMNWVGGVGVPEAAIQLFGQGGIPSGGRVNGGEISHIDIEQVWVEAWVDYEPSRASKHQVGDSWIPLDASFKQYDYSGGYDFVADVPVDALDMVRQFSEAVTVNEIEGWEQGLNQTQIETALSSYQQQIDDYISSQNAVVTTADILGNHKVIQQEFQQLFAGLPYKVVARTHNYSTLPDSLRHKFKYTLGQEYYGIGVTQLMTVEQSLPEIAGEKIVLSFIPATQADEDLIASYLPEDDPVTGETDLNDLPSQLPGYLIGLVAELELDGDVVVDSNVGYMGDQLIETIGLWTPAFGWSQAENYFVAGQQRAIAIDLQGYNLEESRRLQAELEIASAALENGDEGQLVSLAESDVMGDILYATLYSYFALNDLQDQIQSRVSGVVGYRLPSFGVFSTSLNVAYLYGVPREVKFSSFLMDVDQLAFQYAAKGNSLQVAKDFLKNVWTRASALEHLVPEAILSTETDPAQGVSAVKAIMIATAEGQKIWTIGQSNLELALAEIELSADVEVHIRDAVNAGNIATTHENRITFNGWEGEGYIVEGPHSGTIGYYISGGASGGETTVSNERTKAFALTYGIVKDFWTLAKKGLTLYIIDEIISTVPTNLKRMADTWEFALNNSDLDIVQRELLIFAISGIRAAVAMLEEDIDLPGADVIKVQAALMFIMLYVNPYMGALFSSLA